jgi:hypothetical protein
VEQLARTLSLARGVLAVLPPNDAITAVESAIPNVWAISTPSSAADATQRSPRSAAHQCGRATIDGVEERSRRPDRPSARWRANRAASSGVLLGTVGFEHHTASKEAVMNYVLRNYN